MARLADSPVGVRKLTPTYNSYNSMEINECGIDGPM
jgi:hypothetical protein